MTVSYGLRCEKKLKVKRLLKLYSASKGTISIRTYLDKFNDIQPGKICTQFLKTFPYDTIGILCVKEDDLSLLLLISEYVTRKTMEKTDCSSCKSMFGSLEKPYNLDIYPEHFTYFDSINRGGLMFPSIFFNIILCGYCIFNLSISKELESRFLALEYQKHTLIGTMENYIVNNDKYSGVLSCDMCETEIIIMVRKTLTCFSNILLNDYTIAQSDKVSTTKIAKKYLNFLEEKMPLIYYYYTVYSKLSNIIL